MDSKGFGGFLIYLLPRGMLQAGCSAPYPLFFEGYQLFPEILLIHNVLLRPVLKLYTLPVKISDNSNIRLLTESTDFPHN